jgi:hypothetical protein
MEKEQLILLRVKGKGDTWQLDSPKNTDPEHPSLTQALEYWFNKTQIRCAFRLEPLEGKVFALIEDGEDIPTPKYNIYGELS